MCEEVKIEHVKKGFFVFQLLPTGRNRKIQLTTIPDIFKLMSMSCR